MTLFDKMEKLIAEWKPHRAYMGDAIERTNGTHTEDDVLAMILGGKLKLWSGTNAALVTEFVDYPRLKALNVFLCGAEPNNGLDELLPMHTAVEQFAKESGCKRLTAGGREGWHRVLARALPGYELGGNFMFKDL